MVDRSRPIAPRPVLMTALLVALVAAGGGCARRPEVVSRVQAPAPVRTEPPTSGPPTPGARPPTLPPRGEARPAPSPAPPAPIVSGPEPRAPSPRVAKRPRPAARPPRKAAPIAVPRPAEPEALPAATVVRDVLAALSPDRIVFNPPREMTEGTRERVEVRISGDLAQDLTRALSERGGPQAEAIKVEASMTAELAGTAFEITAQGSGRQVVGGGHPPAWDWDVTPLRAGLQRLSLNVGVRVKMPDGGEEWKDLPVLDRDIQVARNPWWRIVHFWTTSWRWLFLLLFLIAVGILGWLWSRWSARRKRRARA